MKKTQGTGGAMAELLSKHNEQRTKDGGSVSPQMTEEMRRELIRQKKSRIMEEIHRSEEDLGGGEVQPVKERAEEVKTPAPRKAPPRKVPQKKIPLKKEIPAPKAEHKEAPQPIPRAQSTPPKKAESAKGKKSGFIPKPAAAAGALLALAAAVFAVILLIRPEDEEIVLPAEHKIGAVETVIDETLESVSLSASAGKGLQLLSFNIYGADSISCLTEKTTVGELVEEAGIVMNEAQVIRQNGAEETKDGMIISIDTVTYKTETFTEYKDYDVKYVDVQNIPRGTEQVYFKGSMGETVSTYNIKYVNGVQSERTLVSETVTKSPLTQIMYRGVGGTLTVGGKSYSYSYFIDCKTTVYCLEGITASGKPVGYDVIAVDPKVIPLGTQVYVDDPYTYVGFRTAADTGGAIKGNFIDIWFKKGDPNFSSYGVRSARVYILD